MDNDLERFLDTLNIKNTHNNIIGYYKNNFKSLKSNETQLFLLKKPFRLITLLNQLENIKTLNNLENANKTLMSHIIFSPSKKIISNLETKKIEHLTEKENNLLTYLFNRKNVEVLKKDLLTNIGVFLMKLIHTH